MNSADNLSNQASEFFPGQTPDVNTAQLTMIALFLDPKQRIQLNCAQIFDLQKPWDNKGVLV